MLETRDKTSLPKQPSYPRFSIYQLMLNRLRACLLLALLLAACFSIQGKLKETRYMSFVI